MNNLQIFVDNEFGSIRSVVDNENKIYFVAKDVSIALGYTKLDAMYRRLSDNHKLKINPQSIGNAGFPQIDGSELEPNENIKSMILITEGGLYKAILGSTLKSAERFQDWVTDVVLPQIRSTGGYIPIDEDTSDEEIMAKALIVAQKTIAKKNDLIKTLEPKAENYELLIDSKGDLDFGQLAKSIDGLKIGRNALMSILRDNKILMSDNTPYQQYVTQGYFRVIQVTKGFHSNPKTLTTKKGLDWVIKKCKEWGII